MTNYWVQVGKRLTAIRGKMLREDFASRLGVSYGSMSRYERGEGSMKADFVARLVQEFDVDANWLLTGRNSTRSTSDMEAGVGDQLGMYVNAGDEFALVPRYDVAASAGHGAIVETEEVAEYLGFRRDWLRSEGLDVDRLAIIRAVGDSMEPTIASGDTLLLDLSDNQPADGVYALQIDGHLLVKRLQRRVTGSLLVTSDNSMYPPHEVTPDQVNIAKVVGRVVWIGKRL